MGLLYRSRRERADAHWRYFGRPVLVAFGVAMLLGLCMGIGWSVVGLWRFGHLL